MSESLTAFLLLCLVVELTPGPNMAYLAVLSVGAGACAGVFAVAGIAAGLLLVGVLAALGVAAIVSESLLLARLLVAAGCFYLLWLAWCSWQEEPELSPDHVTLVQRQYFLRGLITNLLNPKAFLFYVMVLPGFVKGSDHLTSYALLLTLISVTIATCVHLGIVFLGSQVRPYVNQPHRRRLVRRMMALMLVAIAIWLAVANAGLIF